MQTRGGGIGLRKGSSRMEDYALILTEKKRTLKYRPRGVAAGRITTVRSIEAVGLDLGGEVFSLSN